MIADQILHKMLCELDEDKGINKAFGVNYVPEEMPSFLTRGIKTDTLTINEYLNGLFDKIKEDKAGFLDSLSTPLNRDPLEILGHLQDIETESNQSESDNMPFQQSVLHVELYLDNEKQRRLDKMTEEERRAEIENKEKRRKEKHDQGVIFDSDDIDDDEDESIMAEWDNIHNKVIFD